MRIVFAHDETGVLFLADNESKSAVNASDEAYVLFTDPNMAVVRGCRKVGHSKKALA